MRCTTCLGLALALSGCVAGPDYRRPELPAPPRYTESDQLPALAAGEADPAQRLLGAAELPAQWWTLFQSPALDALVRSALANNPSLAAAEASLRAAQENMRAQRAAYYPSVDLGYAGSRQRIADALASPASSNASLYSLHTAQVTVSYAPDLFGGNRRLVESLQAQAEGQRWAMEAAHLTLTSNLVLAVVQEGSLRAQMAVTQRLVEIQRDILERYRRLLLAGQVAELDVAQQEAALAQAEVAMSPLQTQLEQQRDLIKALCGRWPADALDASLDLEGLRLPQALPLTLPSRLAEQRPDILAAEAQLRAASAGIGVAAANRLPIVSLGVDAWGSSAYTLAQLFRPGTAFWTLSGSLTQSVFDAGGLKHREDAARAGFDQALAQYRSAVINAFQNVADVLQALAGDARTLKLARRAQEAADRSLAMARRQLALGDVSALAVMQSEQAALQASLAVVQAQASRLSDSVALFQALGGGWWSAGGEPVAQTTR